MIGRRKFLGTLGIIAAGLLLPRFVLAWELPPAGSSGGKKKTSADFVYTGYDRPNHFREEIAKRSTGKLLCVMFVTDWCPNCKAQHAHYQKIVGGDGFDLIDVLALDVEQSPMIGRNFPRHGPVPDNYFFYNGESIGGFLGASRSVSDLKNHLKGLAEKHGFALKG